MCGGFELELELELEPGLGLCGGLLCVWVISTYMCVCTCVRRFEAVTGEKILYINDD